MIDRGGSWFSRLTSGCGSWLRVRKNASTVCANWTRRTFAKSALLTSTPSWAARMAASRLPNNSQSIQVSYTQPGSNKVQDLAGNLAANLSNQGITNGTTDTVAPTVTSGRLEVP